MGKRVKVGKFCQDREGQSEFLGQLGKNYQKSTISFKAPIKFLLKNWSNLICKI